MLQREIGEIFKELPSAFGIVDDIFTVGFDDQSTDHDRTLSRVLQICREENLKLNEKSKCHFRGTSIPFFVDIIYTYGIQPDPLIFHLLTEIPLPKPKRKYNPSWTL